MNRQQAKEILPIIEAYAAGKTIQVKSIIDGLWYDCGELSFKLDPQKYRIKPESKYRPFVTDEECWNEMLKHQPFGWVKHKETKLLITEVSSIRVKIGKDYLFQEAKEEFTFIDGTPFGIKENKVTK